MVGLPSRYDRQGGLPLRGRTKLKRLKIQPILRQGDDLILTIGTVPSALDVHLPLTVRIHDDNGFFQELKSQINEPLTVRNLPQKTLLQIEALTGEAGFIGHSEQHRQPFDPQRIRPDQRQVYSGDLSQRIAELVPTWEQARLFLRSDTFANATCHHVGRYLAPVA